MTLAQATTDALWIVDHGGKILFVNTTACDLYGYTNEEFLKMQVADFQVKASTVDLHTGTNIIMREGAYRYRTNHKRKDGAPLHLEVNALRLGEKGNYLALMRKTDGSTLKKAGRK